MRMSSAPTSVANPSSTSPVIFAASPVLSDSPSSDSAPVDHVQVAAAPRTEGVLEPPAIGEVRDQRSRVLGEVQPVGAGRAHDLEPAVGAVLQPVLPLLHARLEAPNARQDPELDEAHGLVRGAVLLRVQVAPMRERHDLGRTGLEVPVVAEGIGMEEVALDDVGERLDVLVRVERPLGAGHDPIVVEDAERTHAHLLGIAVPVEAEVPAGVEPAALLAPDRVRLADGDVPARRAHVDPWYASGATSTFVLRCRPAHSARWPGRASGRGGP